MTAPSSTGRGRPRAALVLAATWLLAFGMLQWSVVRFRLPIVGSLTLAAVLLGLWLARRADVRPDRVTAAAVLVGSAVIALTVPLFSYLPDRGRTAALAVLVVAALSCAALLAARVRPVSSWAPAAAALTATGAYAVASAVAIRTDPAPRIDVWVVLQQSSDALARGESFYGLTWTGSPGIKDAFTYLPWTTVLLAPGRLLAGDVRWMLALWFVVATVGLWVLAGGRRAPVASRWRAAFAVSVLALAPGTLTQVDQAWTEPLLFAGLVWWAVLVHRGHAWWAVVPLALMCASKQHLALALPLLLLWRPFGVRRTVATGALAGALIAPWFLAGPAVFVHDTVTLLVGFHPIRFANTWYLVALNELGVTLPFWVTGLVVLGTLATAVLLVARRQPETGELLRWLALVLLVANLVNKQAFYNQFWLSGALVMASLVADVTTRRPARPRRARAG